VFEEREEREWGDVQRNEEIRPSARDKIKSCELLKKICGINLLNLHPIRLISSLRTISIRRKRERERKTKPFTRTRDPDPFRTHFKR